MKSYQQFFAELKRRHVFRVAAIYGATSFVVLQAAELVLPRLGLPDWTVTFMVAILLLAFPVALILAWAFEVTPEGVRRTEAAELDEIATIVAQPAVKRWASGLLALAGVAALLASGWWIGRRSAEHADAAGGDTPANMRLALDADGQAEGDDRPSIAVLPFVNMSADENQEYFSDGITEELLNTLARIRELKVAARTSAFAYKGRQIDLREVGDSLGVAYLVEGSVRKAGEQLRITAQLIDARDGTHLWSEQYDRELNDVFAIQTEIAEAIALGYLTSNRLRTYLWAGRWTEAREHFLGRPGVDEARRERIARLWQPGLRPPVEVAEDVTEAGGPAAIHLWLAAGDVERAYAIFEQDFLANSFGQRSLLWMPDLLEVQDDPRYQEAVRRSHLVGRTVRLAAPE